MAHFEWTRPTVVDNETIPPNMMLPASSCTHTSFVDSHYSVLHVKFSCLLAIIFPTQATKLNVWHPPALDGLVVVAEVLVLFRLADVLWHGKVT